MESRTARDDFVAWAKRQIDDWELEIPLFENGTIQVFEMENGVRIDTTRKCIDYRRENIAELTALIQKHKR